MMQTLHSISPINHCYQTYGSKPVRILCNDLENYVCKYYTGGSGPAYNLFNEYLAASFLKLWNLPVPDFALVKISKSHMEGLGFPYHFFEMPCFGSRFMGDFKEVDKVFMGMPKDRFKNPESVLAFIWIAMFDIWLCNEDRSHNNFNLLYNMDENHFIPIDHVNVFNGLNIDKQPYLISENESILNSPLFRLFFFGTLQPKAKEFRSEIEKTFKRHIALCNENLHQIFSDLPIEWKLDIPFIREKITFFFSEEWQTTSLNHFFDLFYHNYKRIKL
jgi:hypothetical protein